jgi:hypothetical protein
LLKPKKVGRIDWNCHGKGAADNISFEIDHPDVDILGIMFMEISKKN